MMMMVMRAGLRAGLRGGLRSRTGTVAVGTEHIAGCHTVGAAPEFGSGTSAHVLRVVRTGMVARFVPPARVRRCMLPLGRVQPKHVQQNGGDVSHQNERNEHDEPRENGETSNAQLIQQDRENNHDNDL